MHIVSLRIRDFLSLTDVEIKPGRITQIVGGNNQGKTSILKALDFAVQGSNDPSLVRLGQDSAEVLVELSDQTTIRRRINSEGRQSVEVKRDGMKSTSPQALLGALFDQSSFNPLELLNAKQRTEAILKSIDIPMNGPMLAGLLGVAEEELPPLDYNQHGLKVIEAAHKFYYQRRAEANRDAAEKQKRFETYKKDLPELPPAPPHNRASIHVTKNNLNIAINEETSKVHEINRRHQDAENAQKRVNSYVAEANKIDLQIRDKEAELNALKARREQAQLHIEKAQSEVPAELPSVGPHEAKISEFKKELSDLELLLKEWDRVEAIEQQHKMVDVQKLDFELAEKFAAKITEKVDALHGPIKRKLMTEAEMPIKGLEYKDGQFLIDGVSVDNLSSSAALKLAIGVARKLAKKTKIICVDGAEQLDAETWKQFVDETANDGFSYFVTKVGEPYIGIDPAIPGHDKTVKMQAGQVIQ